MDPRRAALGSASVALVGALVSGPIGLWVVGVSHPQPAWSDVATFSRAYHPVQTVPYLAGFLLVGGFVLLLGALREVASVDQRVRATWGFGLAATFAAIIFVNYALQTTFIPAMIADPDPRSQALIGALTMTNPRSIGWALEMWGYAVLGVATWCSAPVFTGARLGRSTATLFFLNGPVSLATALATAWRPGWVVSPLGLAGFFIWNALIVAMLLLAMVVMRRSLRAPLGDGT